MHLIQYFFKSSILVQIALYFSNNFSSPIWRDINLFFLSSTLNVLTYLFILGIIKTNGVTSLSKYPIKYLELVFVLTNFEITILSALKSQIFIVFFFFFFFQHKTFLLQFLSFQASPLLYYRKKIVIMFWLVDLSI